MAFDNNFKLPEALKFGDITDIGNGYTIELEPADPNFVWYEHDDDDINVRHQTVMTIRDNRHNLITEIKNTPLYECTGGNEEISEENRKVQEGAIRQIIDRLPEILEEEIKAAESKVSYLNEKIYNINKVLDITGKSRDFGTPSM